MTANSRRLLLVFGLLAILTIAWAAAYVRSGRVYVQYDAYSWESIPDANNGGSNNFQIMSYNRPPNNMRGFIQFNVSQIPGGSMVLSATMRLRVWWKSEADASRNVGDPTGRSYGAFPMLAAWEEYGINWSNQPKYDDKLFAASNVPAGQGGWGANRTVLWMDWDIRPILTEWVNGRPNYGLVIRDLHENSPIAYATQFFAHDQVPGLDFFPQLEVTYVAPLGTWILYALIAGWVAAAVYFTLLRRRLSRTISSPADVT